VTSLPLAEVEILDALRRLQQERQRLAVVVSEITAAPKAS
jgi:CBS domain containing-hemolysin-like protein